MTKQHLELATVQPQRAGGALVAKTGWRLLHMLYHVHYHAHVKEPYGLRWGTAPCAATAGCTRSEPSLYRCHAPPPCGHHFCLSCLLLLQQAGMACMAAPAAGAPQAVASSGSSFTP